MKTREPIKEWSGKIIGWIETDEHGNKVLKDFYNRVLGSYNKNLNLTRDFYNRPIAKGDNLLMLLRR